MTSSTFVLVCGVILGHASSSMAQPAPAEPSPFAKAEPLGTPVVYKTAAGRPLHLYVVKPPGWTAADRRPALVFFHGGGWTQGRPVQFNEHCAYFATRGLVCAQVEYRLLDAATDDPPLVCARDAKSAMRWVRSHAGDLGIDPGRIGAAGGSAGGHLAAATGMISGLDDPDDDTSISARPDALVLFNPVLDANPVDGYNQRTGSRYREYSPAHHVTRDAPPAIIFLGSRDKLIPVSVMRRFQARMQEAGVRCDLLVFEGQPHAFFNFSRGTSHYYETVIAADEFLSSLRWIEGPPTLVVPEALRAPASASGR